MSAAPDPSQTPGSSRTPSARPEASQGNRLSLLERLFAGALQRPAGPSRKRWLQNAAGGDPDLVSQVTALLDAHEASSGFLESGAVVNSHGAAEPEEVKTGSRVGPYTLVEELGEGGFGVVFRATQEAPLRREVALKVIKLGMDTRQVIARFEAERHALSLLDHPSIARALDAGATDRGRPFFVMDLVPGQPITTYCDNHRLNIRQRLEVFLDLCGAIQHAHQRGVIHRDIKPSNVLVTETEGRPVPKVIDFGIAKATSAEQSGGTLFTEMGQVIGTPVYMSPEQASGSADIDTRTDVYSLGVVLHELLTGEPPFPAEVLREHASSGDIAEFLAQSTPSPMATRVAPDQPGSGAVSQMRRSTPSELRRLLHGDLENIVHCALSPERDRRYESSAAFARDINRLLTNRPVEAAPPSAIYRASKFLRRHQVAAVASAAVLAALIGGLTVAFKALSARQEQAGVLREIFSATRYSEAPRAGADASRARTMQPAELDRMVIRAFGTQDAIRVDALGTLADRLVSAGQLEAALEAQTAALEAASEIHGATSAQAARQRAALGLLHARRGDRLLARRELEGALQLDRQTPGPTANVLHQARLELARLLEESGDRAGAIDLLEEADRIATTMEEGDGSLRTEALRALLPLVQGLGDADATRRVFERLLDQYALRYSEDSSFLVRRQVEYASWLASVGLAEEASLPLDVALDALDRTAAPPLELLYDTLAALNRVYAQEPSLTTDSEAQASLDREIEVARRRFSPEATEYLETLARCADDFERRGAIGRSTELLNERFERFETVTGENELLEATQRARTALAEELLNRADAIRRQGGLALDDYRAAHQAAELAAPYFPGNRNLLQIRLVLATRTGEFKQMLSLLEEFERASGAEGLHPLTLAMQAIAFHQSPTTQLLARRRLSEAQELARRPEFFALPGLQEALDWAAEAIYGEG